MSNNDIEPIPYVSGEVVDAYPDKDVDGIYDADSQTAPEGPMRGKLSADQVRGASFEELVKMDWAKTHGLLDEEPAGEPDDGVVRRSNVLVYLDRPEPIALPAGSSEGSATFSTGSGPQGAPEERRTSSWPAIGVILAIGVVGVLGVRAIAPSKEVVASTSSAEGSATPSSTISPSPNGETESPLPSTSTSPSNVLNESLSPAGVSLVPVPTDAVFGQPACSVITIRFVNTEDGSKQSIVPIEWDFMKDQTSHGAPDAFIAPGKLAGQLGLSSCLTDTSAIQYDAEATKRLGISSDGQQKVVYTVDYTKVVTTPDVSNLQNGIALSSSVDTDPELLAAMQAVNPKATMNDVNAFKQQLSENETKVEKLDLLTALDRFHAWYDAPALEATQESIEASILGDLEAKGYDPDSILLVPKLSENEQFALNIDDKLPTGPFTPRPDLAPGGFPVIVTRLDTGEQLQPEKQS